MKRVFSVVGFSFVFSLLLLNEIISDYAVIFIGVSAAAFLISVLIKPLRKSKEIPCIFLSFILAAFSFLFVTQYSYKPQFSYVGKECEIKATVLDIFSKSSSGNFSYLIRTKEINGEKKRIKMRLYTPYDISSQPYDEIEFSSKPFAVGDNSRATLRYFKGRGIYLGAYTKEDVFVSEPSKKPLISFFSLQKEKSEKQLRQYLSGDYAEFAISLLFGDKSLLSGEMKDSFSAAGLSHIMAVSGLHMSVWVMGLYLILNKFGLDRRLTGAFCIVASWCLVCFCAFSVSVIRATVMLSIYLSAVFFKRRSDALNSLGFAAFIICLLNPFAVCDVSFLLSFFATLGIVSLSEALPSLFTAGQEGNKFINILSELSVIIFVCFAANIFTAPVLISRFSSLNLYSVIGNTLVYPVVAPALLLSGALSVCPFGFLSEAVASLLPVLEKFIFSVTAFTSSLPLSRFMSASSVFRLLLPFALISCVFVLYTLKKKKLSPCALLCALSLIIITVS